MRTRLFRGLRECIEVSVLRRADGAIILGNRLVLRFLGVGNNQTMWTVITLFTLFLLGADGVIISGKRIATLFLLVF